VRLKCGLHFLRYTTANALASFYVRGVFQYIQVFKFVYCDTFLPEMVDVYKSQCLAFTHAVERNCPELRRKLKIHILLHLPDDMLQFGPASTFNTERL